MFWTKLCNSTNSKVLISNLKKIFFKFWPKSKVFLSKSKIKHFWSQVESSFVLNETLQFHKFEGADFKYDNSFLKIAARKYTNKTILISNLKFFCFCETFKSADFKYVNSFFFFSNSALKHPRFFFARNFAVSQIWACWFQT